ncbi:Serine/threonine-protein kinase [Coemansia sp. RSA 988]|nr:Serine/threonine-protein kinase [Coemansia sp. RSA 988]
MLESGSSDLDMRLAFTLNLDTLNEHNSTTAAAVVDKQTEAASSRPRVRRGTFKKLIGTRRRASSMSRRRRDSNNHGQAQSRNNNNGVHLAGSTSGQFHLQQLHLPSPIASFSPDLWANGSVAHENNNILSLSIPAPMTPSNNLTDDDDIVLAELTPHQIVQNNDRAQHKTAEIAAAQRQPARPATPPTMQAWPRQRISASSDQLLNSSGLHSTRGRSNADDNESQHATQPPRRGRSLMFKPLLDVSAVGTLIDTISKGNQHDDRQSPRTPNQLEGRSSGRETNAIKVPAPPRRKILGSLRRATAITQVGRSRSERLKTGRVRRQHSQHVKAIFQRSVPGMLRPRPRSHEIRPIETIQGDDDDDAAAVGVVLPPPPQYVRRAGTVKVVSRAPGASLHRQRSLRWNHAIPAEAGVPNRTSEQVSVEQAEPTTAEPLEPTYAELPETTATEAATKSTAAPAAGFQAAVAVMTAATFAQEQQQSQLAQPEDTVPGYAPIAVSLKSTRSRQFLLNTPLGEFEVLRTVGQGSYGKVKLMRSALTNEQFAVKIIKRYPPHKHRRQHTEYRKAKTLDRRVVREANLASILGQLHPHIVELHDFRVTDTHFYLFYAYVSGATLAERVGHGGLPENDARCIFKAVAETIHFCHQYSVIHRDIKLENVLIDSGEDNYAWAQQRQEQSGSGSKSRGTWTNRSSSTSASALAGSPEAALDGRVKLIDFGLANFFDGQSLMDTFCGSLPYTAPEILRGDAYVGPEVDVWSLGVLLYVMMTGHFPFEDPAQPRNYDRIMAGDFTLQTSMSRALQELLVRMLEPAPQRRISMLDVLRHPWLASHPTPPGVCCTQHAPAAPTGIHTRRTLTLPGPRASRLAAREAALCLGRSVDDVVRAIDAALTAGTPLSNNQASSRSAAAPWSLLAPVHQWAGTRDLRASELREVANSPYVSVYALVLQQIAMRRYYLELPTVEASAASSACASSASFHQLLVQQRPNPLPRSVPATGSRGLRGLLPQESGPNASAIAQTAESRSAVPDVGSLEAEALPQSRTLVGRLAAQLVSLVSLAVGLLAGEASSSRTAGKGATGRGLVHELPESLVPPAYMQPLNAGQENAITQQSMPVLPRKRSGHTRRMLFSAARRRQKSQHADPPVTASNEPTIRIIGALEDIHERIPLPVELSTASSVRVLGLLSALLSAHEIAHTFVEKQQMPMQRALDSSIFSLKTIAALVSRSARQQQQDNPMLPNSALQNNTSAIFTDAFTSQDVLTALSDDHCNPPPPPPSLHQSRVHGSGLRARLHDALARPRERLAQKIPGHLRALTPGPTTSRRIPTIVHPHLQQPQTKIQEVTRNHCTQQLQMSSIVATVPVKHATAVILAQYSPSLNRWRETEVVEYYSCAVRLELVQIGPIQLRPRYALLVTRMTGHRGKFDLFRAFLCRIVAALPSLTPVVLPRPVYTTLQDSVVTPLNQATRV